MRVRKQYKRNCRRGRLVRIDSPTKGRRWAGCVSTPASGVARFYEDRRGNQRPRLMAATFLFCLPIRLVSANDEQPTKFRFVEIKDVAGNE